MNLLLSFLPAVSAAGLALLLSSIDSQASPAPSLLNFRAQDGLQDFTIAPEGDQQVYATATNDGDPLELHIISGPQKSYKFKVWHDKDTSVYVTDDKKVPPAWIHNTEGDLKSLYTPVEL